jgi:E3 ubiquitin-protein ligase TRIP12
VARDREVFLGRMTSEIARVDRSMILPMAERLIAWTAGSKAMLEVQFEGESGFGDGATQSFYSEVALALMKRALNKEVPMWVETDRSDESDFIHSARGFYPQPLEATDKRLHAVCARFRFLGQLMSKALRDGFFCPVPLAEDFFRLFLRENLGRGSLPQPQDGWAGGFVGACARYLRHTAEGKTGLEEDWGTRYMNASGSLDDWLESASFVATGTSGPPLVPGGEDKAVTRENLEEFVEAAETFWLRTGVQKQIQAFRDGVGDATGSAIVSFRAVELQQLFCGREDIQWTEKDLRTHLQVGGGFTLRSQPVQFLISVLAEMPAQGRAKFLEFATACPRLPPGGLASVAIKIHPVQDEKNRSRLPRSHACTNTLHLPSYDTKEELREALTEAIEGSAGIFELE